MSNPITKYLAAIGARGGKAGTGKSKARTKSQARAAAKARWDKARALRQSVLSRRLMPGFTPLPTSGDALSLSSQTQKQKTKNKKKHICH
jgi:hypothetical protein